MFFFRQYSLAYFIFFILCCNNNDQKNHATNEWFGKQTSTIRWCNPRSFQHVTVSWIVALFCRKELWFICDTWRWKVLLLLHWSNRISTLWYGVKRLRFWYISTTDLVLFFQLCKILRWFVHILKCWIQWLKENLLTFNL